MQFRVGLLEKEIISFLLAKGSEATTHEISSSVQQNYNSAAARLEKLQTLGLVRKIKEGRITLWEVDR